MLLTSCLYEGSHDRILDFYEEPDESSDSIKNTIIRAIQKLGLDPKCIVSYTADNASVNYGKNCSVYTKLQTEINSQLIKANCNCHVLHNAAKKALKVLSFDIEVLILKVYAEFSTSAKRVAELKVLE